MRVTAPLGSRDPGDEREVTPRLVDGVEATTIPNWRSPTRAFSDCSFPDARDCRWPHLH